MQSRLFKNVESQYQGMLQICSSTQMWEAVCDYNWQCDEAIVAGKQLGYTSTDQHKLQYTEIINNFSS